MLKTKEQAASLRARAASELESASEGERWRALTLLTEATRIERELGIAPQVSMELVKKSEIAAQRRGRESVEAWIRREEEIKRMVSEYINPVRNLERVKRGREDNHLKGKGYKPMKAQLEFKLGE